jgi:hypothetical protein
LVPADHPKMTDDRLALIVRSAFRGMMEAVLAVDAPALPQAVVNAFGETGRVEPTPEEIAFPSVSKAEETLFGETPPPTFGMTSSEAQIMGEHLRGNRDLDETLAALAKARAMQEQNLQPQTQGGPGEKDVAEWLRLPQQ